MESSIMTTAPAEGPQAVELPEFAFYSFLTGPAGTGKSTIVRTLPSSLLCATTGIAGINLGAATLHSTLGFYDTQSLRTKHERGKLKKAMAELAEDYETLVIDEVSMLPAEQFDLLIAGNRAAGEPLKILCTGDFAQLPPVKAPYAFEGHQWRQTVGNGVVRLSKIWRQSDQAFLEGLALARSGQAEAAVRHLIDAGVQFCAAEDPSFEGTTIIPTNERVDRYNQQYLDGLGGEPVELKNVRRGKPLGEWKELPQTLRLKEGALVMILVNDTQGWRYGNGSLGTVESFQWIGSAVSSVNVKLQSTGEIVQIDRKWRFNEAEEGTDFEVKCMLTGRTFETGKAWKAGSKTDDDGIESDRWVIGSLQWWPLRVAKATSVHKSQGLTLDSVQCLISGPENKFFGAPHMAYVAMSRARDPKRLRIVGNPRDLVSRIKADPKVRTWL